MLLTEALKKLRAVGAISPDKNSKLDLWRGMSNMEVAEVFHKSGGTEMALLSTTTKLDVAVHYSSGGSSSLILKLNTSSAMERGADISFLSAFPTEAEVLFPPLIYLRPTGKVAKDLEIGGRSITVVEVVPVLGS